MPCVPPSSPSARKVWIEISKSEYIARVGKSPSARKVWIEIVYNQPRQVQIRRHLPRGRCGLKYLLYIAIITTNQSPSARKVWIEILCKSKNRQLLSVTFREEGVDWNHYQLCYQCLQPLSPSARKVWIEIVWLHKSEFKFYVTFREEGVDWN